MSFPELKISPYKIEEQLEDWPTVFSYHFWSSDRTLFKQMTSRWENAENILSDIIRKIVNDDDIVWDKILHEGSEPIKQIEASGGEVQYSEGPVYKYKRDLRGLKFFQTQLFDVINSLHYTRLEYCKFEKIILKGNLVNRFGTTFLFRNNISFSYFSECVFEKGSFWEGTCKNVVFYNCRFESFALNVNFNDYENYSNIAFLNCEFVGVDLSRIDIRSCLFSGRCRFNNVVVDDTSFNSFSTIGENMLNTCKQYDKDSWATRRRIKGITYTSIPDGKSRKSTKTINYYLKGEEDKSRSKKFQNTLPAYRGLSKLYEYLITYYESKHHHVNLVRCEYVFNWLTDQNYLFSKGWFFYPKLFVSRILLGYGYRAHRPLLAWFIIVFMFSLGYLFTGITYNQKIILRYLSLDFKEIYPTLFDFGKCLYFSIITSTTVGYGDMTPNGIFSHALAATQSILGLLFFYSFYSSFDETIVPMTNDVQKRQIN